MLFKKYRLEIPFKGENVKALIKRSQWENLVLYFSKTFQQIAVFAVLYGFQWQNNRLEIVMASPNDQKSRRYQLVLKSNATLAQPLRLVILYFLLKLFSDDRRLFLHDKYETWDLMLMGSTIQNKLPNLFCIL